MLGAKRAAFLDAAARVALAPGAPELLPAARRRFRDMAIATSAARSDLDLLARRHDLLRWFDAIVTGDDTVRHKPDPEPYLRAVNALRVHPRDALVIENAPFGVQSATEAGLCCVALTTSLPAQDLKGAHRIVADLHELRRLLLPA